MKKLFSVFTLICLLAIATASADTIDVFYNDISVYINGAKTEFTDAMGNPVEPFIYNGNVYLPLPAVAEAMGIGYSWDGSTMSAHLGVAAGEKQYLLDVCPPYQEKNVEHYTTENGKSFAMAGQSYTNGMMIETSTKASDPYGFALFNLNGKYKTLEFTAGHIDGESMHDTTIQVYLDGKLAKEFPVAAEGLPYQASVDLNNALSMKIVVICKYYDAECCGIADIVVK